MPKGNPTKPHRLTPEEITLIEDLRAGKKVEPEQAIQDKIDVDVATRKIKAELNLFKSKYKTVLERYEESEKKIDDLIYLKEPVDIYQIEYKDKFKTDEATPIVLLSDFHVEEIVKPSTVNGLNEYTPEIAQKRAVKCFQNIVRLIRKEKQSLTINKLILWMGGDSISGYIHDELVENNAMSPLEALRLAKQIYIAGIDFIMEHAGIEEIIIPASYGNHARTEREKKFSTAAENNYEWLLYHILSEYYMNEPRIKFHIPTGEFNYVKSYDKTLRFFHGDGCKYGGGIGGLSIPLIKYVSRVNSQIHADYSFLGHFHQKLNISGIFVNGSLIGISPYSIKLGCTPERPQQTFLVQHCKWGIISNTDLLVE